MMQLAAAVTLLVQALCLGIYMSVRFRVSALAGKDAYSRTLSSNAFKVAHALPLNNAEWTPKFVAPLLYLHSQSAGSSTAAALSIIGCVGYVATKIVAKTSVTTVSAPFSVLRYLSLAWIIIDVAATR